MSRPDDGLIHAWLDGELDAAEAARVARLVESDAEWGAAAAEARGLIAASSRIVKSLDVVPAGVIPSGSKASGGAPRRVVVRPWLRIAATVALVAGVGYVANESRMADELAQEAPTVSPVVDGDEVDRRAVVQTAGPVTPPPVSPALARDAREGGAGAGVSAEPQRRELAKTSAALSDSIAAASAAARERVANVAAEELREQRLTLRQDSAAPSTLSGRSAVTAIAPPAAASPTVAGLGDRAAGAATEQAKVSARAAEPTAQFAPRQVIDRERAASSTPSAPAAPSMLAASDAMLERVLPGCWRTRTTAPSDSVLVDPRILSVAGDSLVIVLNRASLDIRSLNRETLPRAIVVRVGTSTLNGTARSANGAVVPFSATRTSCP